MQAPESQATIPPTKPSYPIAAIIISVIITALVVGGGMYWWAETKRPQSTTQEIPQELSIPTYSVTSTPDTAILGYRKVGVGFPYLSFQVPITWSVTMIPESVGVKGQKTLPDFPMLSVGQEDVAYGDTNWSQIDFYYFQDDVVDALLKADQAADPRAKLTTETVAGLPAQVLTYPLDENGQVTKGGTGGKSYYIKLPSTAAGYAAKTLYIYKQAIGDEAFEVSFIRLLQTMEIEQNQLPF